MKSYPVYVYRPSYRGADPRKRAKHMEKLRVAARVEEYLNADLAKLRNNSFRVYLNYEVASAIREPMSIVEEIINGTDGGSNGISRSNCDQPVAGLESENREKPERQGNS